LDSNFFEDGDQRLDAIRREAAHDVAVHPVDGAIEGIDEVESVTREPMDYDAAVRVAPIADQEAAFLEAVHQAGDVGVARYETSGDLLGTDPLGGAAEDTEDVVLRGRERVSLQEAGGLLHEEVGGADDGEGGVFLEQAVRPGRPDRVLRGSRHMAILFVGND
jgi:hypothetical protein